MYRPYCVRTFPIGPLKAGLKTVDYVSQKTFEDRAATYEPPVGALDLVDDGVDMLLHLLSLSRVPLSQRKLEICGTTPNL